MSFQIYPKIRGLGWPIKRTPAWETQVQSMSSGKEVRLSYWTNPIWHWEITYGGGQGGAEGYVKDVPGSFPAGFSETDLAVLEGFYNQQQGRFGVFYFEDCTPGTTAGAGPWDSVTNQAIGSGDGTTTTFQLIRTSGGFVESIQSPYIYPAAGYPIVKLNGVTKAYSTDYTVNNVGQIIFPVAPPNSPPTAITATYSYYWAVRFEDDDLGFENWAQYLWSCKSVKLVQVKL